MNRQKSIKVFFDALEKRKPEGHKVVVYYGIGGIGKTSLRKELGKLIENNPKYKTIWAAIDFDISTYREQEIALFVLKDILTEKYKINFLSFDLAYTIYWKKTHPQTPLTKENLPLVGGTSIIAGIAKVLQEVPYISIIPKMSNAIKTGNKVIKEWWVRRGEEELSLLPNLEPKDILDRLPMFWANDLKEYIEKNDCKAVIFLDTFEAIWENIKIEGGFFLRDEWIRELISHLPEVLWVICGREKLRWDEIDDEWAHILEQHLLGNLTENDSRELLINYGIDNTDIQNVIISASKGVPHFIDLALDTYHEIQRKYNRQPEKDDFAKTKRKVLERFLRYLDNSEIETLNIISCARMWDKELFSLLTKKFLPGIPVSPIKNLRRFSFIDEGMIPGNWSMHELMRESLLSRQDTDVVKEIQMFIFDFFNNKLENIDSKNISDVQQNALKEAYYYGKFSLSREYFVKWFNNISSIFATAAKWRTITPLIEDFISYLKINFGAEHEYISDYNITLSAMYELQGKFEESEKLLKESLRIREKLFGENHHYVSKVINNIAVLYAKQGKYDKAEPLFKKALEISIRILGENHPDICNAMNNLAIVNFYNKRFEDAELLYKNALSIREENLGENHPDVAASYNNLAMLYENQERFAEAEPLYKKAFIILEKSLGYEHMNVAIAQYNLANVYVKQSKFRKAEELYKRAIEINKKIYGENTQEVAEWLSNLALLYQKSGEIDKSIGIYLDVKTIYEENFGPLTLNLAETYRNLATLYDEKAEYTLSEDYYSKSLNVFQRNKNIKHTDIIQIINDLANLYLKQGKRKDVKKLLENTEKNLSKSIGSNNPTTKYITNRLKKLLNQ